MATDSVTVVIPTHRQRFLEDTLRGLAGQTNPDIEVIVVENGEKSEHTKQLVDRFSKRIPIGYLFVPEAGLNRARNEGSRSATGSIIALLDDDAVPAAVWIEQILRAHGAYPTAGAVGGPVKLRFLGPPPLWLVGPFRDLLSEVDLGDRPHVLDSSRFPVGMNLSYRREIFDNVDGFDESIGLVGRDPPQTGNDEIEFLNRVNCAATPGVVYWPGMLVEHQVPQSRTEIEYFRHRFFGQGFSDTDSLLQCQAEMTWWDRLRQLDASPDSHRWRESMERTSLGAQAERDRFLVNIVGCRIAYFAGMRQRLLGRGSHDKTAEGPRRILDQGRRVVPDQDKGQVFKKLYALMAKPRPRWKRSVRFSAMCLCQRISFYASRFSALTRQDVLSFSNRTGARTPSRKAVVLQRLVYAGGPAYGEAAVRLAAWAQEHVNQAWWRATPSSASFSAVLSFSGSYSISYVLFTVWSTGTVSIPYQQLVGREALCDGNLLNNLLAKIENISPRNPLPDHPKTLSLSCLTAASELARYSSSMTWFAEGIRAWYLNNKPALHPSKDGV